MIIVIIIVIIMIIMIMIIGELREPATLGAAALLGLWVVGCASRVGGCPTAGSPSAVCRTRVPFWDATIMFNNH